MLSVVNPAEDVILNGIAQSCFLNPAVFNCSK